MHFEETALSVQVRPNDLDSLGHVNNATVLSYFELGRWHWMDQHKLRRVPVVLPVVSRVAVEYRREIATPTVWVRTALDGLDELDEDDVRYRVSFVQKVLIDEGQTLATEARVEVAFVDARTRQLASLQDFFAAARAET